ncbi:Gfo/Idh/MocA family oxidoreductase [Escherichia coli]
MVINCAFIGFGKSTTRYHLPYVLNRKDSWHVAHIFRRHAKPEEQAPIYSHIHFTSNIDEVLNDPDVKLVVVCTHADSHFEVRETRAGSREKCAGRKTVRPTLAQAKELFALAKSKGLTVTPYQNRRFDSCFLTAKKAIESGKLGEIVEVESHFDYYRPVGPEQNLGCRRMARFMALVCIRWTRLFLCSVARITSLMTSAACVIKPILTTPLKRNCFMAT